MADSKHTEEVDSKYENLGCGIFKFMEGKKHLTKAEIIEACADKANNVTSLKNPVDACKLKWDEMEIEARKQTQLDALKVKVLKKMRNSMTNDLIKSNKAEALARDEMQVIEDMLKANPVQQSAEQKDFNAMLIKTKEIAKAQRKQKAADKKALEGNAAQPKVAKKSAKKGKSAKPKKAAAPVGEDTLPKYAKGLITQHNKAHPDGKTPYGPEILGRLSATMQAMSPAEQQKRCGEYKPKAKK